MKSIRNFCSSWREILPWSSQLSSWLVKNPSRTFVYAHQCSTGLHTFHSKRSRTPIPDLLTTLIVHGDSVLCGSLLHLTDWDFICFCATPSFRLVSTSLPSRFVGASGHMRRAPSTSFPCRSYNKKCVVRVDLNCPSNCLPMTTLFPESTANSIIKEFFKLARLRTAVTSSCSTHVSKVQMQWNTAVSMPDLTRDCTINSKLLFVYCQIIS